MQRDIAASSLETDPARWVARAPAADPARQAELCRFRLGIAANSRPPIIPTGRWNLAAQPRYGSTIGQPPAAKAVEDCRWSYEIDLDAVLLPPAPRSIQRPGP